MRTLAPGELREVREFDDSLLSEPLAEPQTGDELEDAFEREMEASGFIAQVSPPRAADEQVREFRAYRPITVEGQRSLR